MEETKKKKTIRVQRTVECGSVRDLSALCGTFDKNLSVLSRELNVVAYVDGLKIRIEGEEEEVSLCERAVESLLKLVAEGEDPDESRVLYCIGLAKDKRSEDLSVLSSSTVAVTAQGKPVKCKTVGQKAYVDAIRNNSVVFGIGPAGTGKTYLAVCLAVQAFKNKQVSKILLTRPAVEAGEKLGFLPGDLQTKVDPYLRPLYDALGELFGFEAFTKLMEKGVIEVAPLAYMRGRTLADSFVILDEAQNTTGEQMKMFLTRLGEGSKMVVTGDVTQIDLPNGKESGLKEAVRILDGVEGIGIRYLTERDVVRHPLVMRIVRAYEKYADGKKDEKDKTDEKQNS